MGSKIDCYIDVASFYSFLAFHHLINSLDLLARHNVEVEFHPIFLGAVHASSGNTPPWAGSKAKREYLKKYELVRAAKMLRVEDIVLPEDLRDLLDLGWTQKPCRALMYIKDHYTRNVYHASFQYLFHFFWTTPEKRVFDELVLAHVLSNMPLEFHGSETRHGSQRMFSEDEVTVIVSNQASLKYQDMLKANSQSLSDLGAFGLPWLVVSNSEGHKEPFFGSDR
ncbi:uncharacterized protein VB005_08996 [Metarhizium brunneum]